MALFSWDVKKNGSILGQERDGLCGLDSEEAGLTVPLALSMADQDNHPRFPHAGGRPLSCNVSFPVGLVEYDGYGGQWLWSAKTQGKLCNKILM